MAFQNCFSVVSPARLLALASLLTIAAFSTASATTNDDYNGADLLKWIQSHPKAIVHPSLEIRRDTPNDASTMLGLYVSSSPDAMPVKKGDILAKIPWDRLIHPPYDSYDTSVFESCRSIWALHKELDLVEKGKYSNYGPYVEYLLTLPHRGITPGDWSPVGRKFLADFILGKGSLPPFEDEWRDEYAEDWVDECGGSATDALQRRAFYLTHSRDEDTLMVPLYDMMNHSNDPAKLNTVSYKPQEAGDAFRFVATRDIAAGEQIYNSYNRCGVCSDVPEELCETYSYYKTPDLFQHFGFVEDLPQSWAFVTDAEYEDEDEDSSDDDRNIIEFCLEKDAESGELVVLWDEDELPEPEDIFFFWSEMNRLRDLVADKEELEKRLVQTGDGDENRMTKREWDTAWRYHQALGSALGAVIVAAEEVGVTDGVHSIAEETEKMKKEAKSKVEL